jgi:hypothetical protein
MSIELYNFHIIFCTILIIFFKKKLNVEYVGLTCRETYLIVNVKKKNCRVIQKLY